LLLLVALAAVGCTGTVAEREQEATPAQPSGYTASQEPATAPDESPASPPDTYSIVRQAIIDRQQIVATYDGHPRELTPHVIGTKDGREQALFFQFGGSSNSGLPPEGDWRCMTIDGLSGVSVREGEWYTGETQTDEPQTCVDLVDAHVGG
jgi:hypothetical protein